MNHMVNKSNDVNKLKIMLNKNYINNESKVIIKWGYNKLIKKVITNIYKHNLKPVCDSVLTLRSINIINLTQLNNIMCASSSWSYLRIQSAI